MIQFADTILRLETRLGANTDAEELAQEVGRMNNILEWLCKRALEGQPITLTAYLVTVDPNRRTVEVRFSGSPHEY